MKDHYNKFAFPIRWENIALTDVLQVKLNAAKTAKLSEKILNYEGFGSFHSPNVDDLIRLLDVECQTPPSFFPSFARKILSNHELKRLGRAYPGIVQDTEKGISGRNQPRNASDSSFHLMECLKESNLPDNMNQNGESKCAVGSYSADQDSKPSISIDPNGQSPPQSDSIGMCPMGLEFREKFFGITPSVVFLNHGAFGSALSGSIAIKHWYEREIEDEVVDFIDRRLFELLIYSISRIARFMRAHPTQLVIVPNATFGLNCGMGLITMGDVVAYIDTEYLAVFNMIVLRCQEVGATHHEVLLSKYLHDEEVMGDDDALTEAICSQLPPGCTVMVLDYITSTTALCFPIFTHIIPALRKKGVDKIIVDGAHAPLQVDLDFGSLRPESQPSVFTANLHKWFSSPKSVGVLWVRQEDIDRIQSVVRSHGATGGFHSKFIWSGTCDFGASLCIPALVDFWESQDCNRIRQHCTNLLVSVVDMLTQSFGTRKVARRSPFMSLVELPETFQNKLITARHAQDLLHDFYKIEVPIKSVEGRLYARISVFVYNTPEEYVYFRESILSFSAQWSQFLKHHEQVCSV
ncbi:unnamed protein product [Phytomonas sp. Hart1]|nr:unnamed protein product [Phytomonas sp. Hart1]|eukprot:CCW68779.1 unnamed protein product [Phytomonas sp. isolate Hart1]